MRMNKTGQFGLWS